MGPGRIICMGPYGPKTTKADVRVETLTLNETKKTKFISTLVLTFYVAHHAPFTFTEALPFQLLTR